MPDYEVTFFKHVLSSDGHPFKGAAGGNLRAR